MNSSFNNMVLLVISCGLISGCGGGPEGPPTVNVTGVITVNGEPIEGLEVAFRSENGPTGIGATDEKGRYRLMLPGGRKGAVKGPNKVMIVGGDPDLDASILEEMAAEAEESGEASEINLADLPVIPTRYNEKTELAADVSDENSEVNFDLIIEK